MRAKLLLLAVALGSLPLAAQTALPAAGQFSVLVAAGAPASTPRHAAAGLGIEESVSASQNFFVWVGLAPTASGMEQGRVLVGVTQALGTTTIAGVPMKLWASAAAGSALSNASKLNLTSAPAAIVAAASTNTAFTAEYVVGAGHQPSWCSRCELGPVAKYIHTSGLPSQIIAGVYLMWSPK